MIHNQAGFKEWWPPVITNQDSLFGTELPKFEEDLYHAKPDLYLIPITGVNSRSIHRVEILDASRSSSALLCDSLSTSARGAGSASPRHPWHHPRSQFDKGVEMVKFAKPEDSMNQLEVGFQGSREKILPSGSSLSRGYCTGDIDSLHASAMTLKFKPQTITCL